MTLKEFRESTDPNLFWTLQSGEHQNLLDEAIEIIENYESNRADWQVIKKVGNPDETDRYLIVYRYEGSTELKYFIGDYDTHYGWNCGLRNVEFIAWRKIPEFDSASILSN